MKARKERMKHIRREIGRREQKNRYKRESKEGKNETYKERIGRREQKNRYKRETQSTKTKTETTLKGSATA